MVTLYTFGALAARLATAALVDIAMARCAEAKSGVCEPGVRVDEGSGGRYATAWAAVGNSLVYALVFSIIALLLARLSALQ